MNFRKLLTTISGELGQKDLQGMRFLCKDIISSAALENASVLRIFELLEKRDKLCNDNTTLLAELLHHLQRKDLLKKLNLSNHLEQGQGDISDYRILLYSLANDLTTNNLQQLVFFFGIPPSKAQDKMCPFDLFTELEKQDIIGDECLGKLTDALESTSRNDLVKRISNYTNHTRLKHLGMQEERSQQLEYVQQRLYQPKIGHHDQGSFPSENLHEQESMVPQSAYVPECSSQTAISGDAFCEEPLDPMIVVPVETMEQTEHPYQQTAHSKGALPFYPVENSPRGICLIINNEEFLENLEPTLSKREGTQIDAVAIENVFAHLGFKINRRDNQVASDIRAELEFFSNTDHTNYDVFVCCILTHGEVNCVLGTDGEPLSIEEITDYFTGSNCPTLLGKPKLFFIQACQGREQQKECFLAPDNDIDADGPGNHNSYSIPNEADFLLGMATVSGHLSFRHKKQGSWYIQALCNLLMKLCNGETDILTILTEVNRVVAEKTGYRKLQTRSKQMPQPKHTLRKQLYLCPLQDHH